MLLKEDARMSSGLVRGKQLSRYPGLKATRLEWYKTVCGQKLQRLCQGDPRVACLLSVSGTSTPLVCGKCSHPSSCSSSGIVSLCVITDDQNHQQHGQLNVCLEEGRLIPDSVNKQF